MGNIFLSGVEDNLVNYTQIFDDFSQGISVPLDYLTEVSGNFGWLVHISQICNFLLFRKISHKEIVVPFVQMFRGGRTPE